MIGIGITTHERRAVASQCIERIKRHSPGCRVVVVDDGSREPYPQAIHHPRALGIARAKNRCLAELADCDHIFLFDDDCYPLTDDWHVPYTESGVDHLCHSWRVLRNGLALDGVEQVPVVHGGRNFYRYTAACGVLLYASRRALRAVGGLDVNYARWGHEHVGWSYRMYNAGMCPELFMDVVDPRLYALDRETSGGFAGTVTHEQKAVLAEQGAPLLEVERLSREWKPFRTGVYCLSVYLTGCPDPQRETPMVPEYRFVRAWAESLARLGITGVLFTDQLEVENSEYLKVIRVPFTGNPLLGRWKLYDQWLSRFGEYCSSVWCTDCTDLEFLNKPAPDGLWVGDELDTVSSPWMLRFGEGVPGFEAWRLARPDRRLLNAGVVGGATDRVRALVRAMADCPPGPTDMHGFNMLAWQFDPEYGRRVTTRFKQFEKASKAFIRHK